MLNRYKFPINEYGLCHLESDVSKIIVCKNEELCVVDEITLANSSFFTVVVQEANSATVEEYIEVNSTENLLAHPLKDRSEKCPQ